MGQLQINRCDFKLQSYMQKEREKRKFNFGKWWSDENNDEIKSWDDNRAW